MAKYIKKTNRITKPTKYTEDWVLNEVTELLRIYTSEEGRKKYLTLQDLVENRDYPRQCISEWRNKFVDNKQISDTISKIHNAIENRKLKLGYAGKLVPYLVRLDLFNNHGWKEKIETEQKIETSNKIDLSHLSTEQIRELLNDKSE